MSTPWVLIDLSWLAWRALHAVGGLEHEDVPTGVIFGFFHQLRQICMDPRVHSNRILIFCDSRRSIRAQAYPLYKAKRHTEKTPEEKEKIHAMRQQMDTLSSKVLREMGFPVYEQEGLESDDIMAWAARRISINARLTGKVGKQGVMITSDGDLYQCITPWVHWFDPQRDVYHTEESFLMKKGVPPQRWGTVKALCGCSTDNVAGIPSVGEVTAVRYLTDKLPPKFKSYQAIVSEKGQEIRKRNVGLVVLPHKDTKPIEIQEPKFNVEIFFHYCKRYGLLSILKERSAWSAFLRGAHFQTRRRGELQK